MRFILIASIFLLVSCATTRIKRYEQLFAPKIGKATKTQMASILGAPVKCEKVDALERCEYRTASQRNDPLPQTAIPKQGMGPDVSAYEYFDVIHVFYDEFRKVRDWVPVVIHP